MSDSGSDAETAKVNGWGIDGSGQRTFLLFACGAVLFFVVRLLTYSTFDSFAGWVLTPLFGIFWVVWNFRRQPGGKAVLAAVVVLIGFTAIHYLAFILAVSSLKPFPDARGLSSSPFVPGAVGGAVGAIGSFLICAAARMTRPVMLPVAAAGTVALVIIGSLGVRFSVFFDFDSVLSPSFGLSLAILYLPWQLAFALVLAKMLKN